MGLPVRSWAGAATSVRRMSELPELRVSDADREATVVRLRVAGGEGRLTLEELAERVEAADAARTRADLDALTADLPDSPAWRASPDVDVPRKERVARISLVGPASLTPEVLPLPAHGEGAFDEGGLRVVWAEVPVASAASAAQAIHAMFMGVTRPGR